MSSDQGDGNLKNEIYDKDKEKGGSSFFTNILKRSVTTHHSGSQPKLVPLEQFKITRSKSANYFRDFANGDSQIFTNHVHSSSNDGPSPVLSNSLLNETLMSTPIVSPERFPSVIIHKRKSFEEELSPQLLDTADFKINAVSPLTGESLKSPQEGSSAMMIPVPSHEPFQRQNLETSNNNYSNENSIGSQHSIKIQQQNNVVVVEEEEDDDDNDVVLSPGALNKLKMNHNSLSKRSVFQEIPSGALTGNQIKNPDDDEVSNYDSPYNSKKNRKKHKIIYCILILLIFLLISSFVPAIIILSNGTESSVKNYLKLEMNRKNIIPFLNQNYGNISNFNPNIVNTPDGLNEKYRTDPQILELMKGYGEPIFHGLAYSPLNALEPNCGVNKTDIMFDLVKLSTVTTRIRNYGMQCNQSDLILDSIQTLNLNMTLSMGIWIGGNDTINRNQIDEMKKVVRKYPSEMFEGIFIGNEVLFREDKSTEELLDYIRETKSYLRSIGFRKVPVGTSEIGSLLNKDLFEECDILGANIHPFFAGNSVEGASNWTIEFLEYQMEPLNYKNKTIIITEVGWPTDGGNFHKSTANIPNFKYFLSDYICKMKNVNYGWYYFEAFDEPWKEIFYEGKNKWETEWGLFKSDRSDKIDLRKVGSC
ncbi:glycoside hydrolase superfamily [Scheffersomyces amazonensis]|uniref:glycoside hydrolase superfamily n=1 Tax=Scheffersomyces amazonensis TaxID=1078765 RepID=UPI00315D9372